MKRDEKSSYQPVSKYRHVWSTDLSDQGPYVPQRRMELMTVGVEACNNQSFTTDYYLTIYLITILQDSNQEVIRK